MPFIKDILQHTSLSIVGMAKNTGKTTCMNYVLRRLEEERVQVAVTSVGVDGEERDVLYDTPKPRICLREGMVFVTAERDFEQKEFPADILAVSERPTPLGRLVTARAKGAGRVVLSGPSDAQWLKESIAAMPAYGVRLTLVDGALSRMSLASPAVTDAMILCTGAACSLQLRELIGRTQFRCEQINLPAVKVPAGSIFRIDSVFTYKEEAPLPDMVYVAGAVTDRFLQYLSARARPVTLVVPDFTRLFIQPRTYAVFVRRGGKIMVEDRARLLAVCTNPTAPEGACLDAGLLREQLQAALGLPVYDIVQIEQRMPTQRS